MTNHKRIFFSILFSLIFLLQLNGTAFVNLSLQRPLSNSLTNISQMPQQKPSDLQSLPNQKPSSLSLSKSNSLTNLAKVYANYSMGSNDTFWVEDLGEANNPQAAYSQIFYPITAIVVNITKSAYIFVQSNIALYYTSGLAQGIGQEFETQIVPKITELGTPSDIDNNSRIIILVFPFRQNGLPTSTIGYFSPLNMHKPSTDKNSVYYYSNYKEIININDLIRTTSTNPIKDFGPTLAHEFFHLVEYNYNPNEVIWLEEGFATFAENFAGFSSGYGYYLQDSYGNGFFLHANDISLTYFEVDNNTIALAQFGLAFLFVQYLYQRFGLNFIKGVMHTSLTGMDAVRQQIKLLEPNVTFEEVYSDWMITNLVNDQSNNIYSYVNFSYRISQGLFYQNLQIVPSNILNKKLPYWSNEFYLLPKSNLQPYTVTFWPELLDNASEYQITEVTLYQNKTWSAEKIPLVNDQSGSFTVQYHNNSDSKVLIVSSMVGNSSGDYYLSNNLYSSGYFTSFNLYADQMNFNVTFGLNEITNGLPTYSFNFFDTAGEIIPSNGVKSIQMDLFKWGSTNVVSSTENIQYDTTRHAWILNGITFKGLNSGQYYFMLNVSLVTNQKLSFRGLTFLVLNNTLSSNNLFEPFNLDPFILALIGLSTVATIVIVVFVLNKQKKKDEQTQTALTTETHEQSFPDESIIEQFKAPSYELALATKMGNFSDYDEYKKAIELGASNIEQYNLVREYNAPDFKTAQKIKEGKFPDYHIYINAFYMGANTFAEYNLLKQKKSIKEKISETPDQNQEQSSNTGLFKEIEFREIADSHKPLEFCTICSRPLIGEIGSCSNCNNHYHYKCLLDWVFNKNCCPFCNQNMTTWNIKVTEREQSESVKNTCSICEKSFYPTDVVIRCENCFCIYHKSEFFDWIKTKGSCPKCKINMQI